MKNILAAFFLVINMNSFASATSPNLTAKYDNSRKNVSIKWQNNEEDVSRFILQRSENNNSWKDIYNLESADFSDKKLEKFSDESPEPANNYYRLKIMLENNSIEYSTAVSVVIGNLTAGWIMYPVPVKDILNLQYNGSEPIKGVVSIFVQTMSGRIFVRRRYSSLSRSIQVPVDNLGRGTYDVRIVINNQLVWNQRFVK